MGEKSDKSEVDKSLKSLAGISDPDASRTSSFGLGRVSVQVTSPISGTKVTQKPKHQLEQQSSNIVTGPKKSKKQPPALILCLPSPLHLPLHFLFEKKSKLSYTPGVYPSKSYRREVSTDSIILVTNVDLQNELNGLEHRTYGYTDVNLNKSDDELFIRRGKPFRMNITFSRNFSKRKDDVKFKFTHVISKETVSVTVDKTKFQFFGELDKWDAHFESFSMSESKAFIQIVPAPDCPVGFWTFEVETGNEKIYSHKGRIAILFNPWNSLDDTYIEDDELIDKLVLSDVGKIFKGCMHSMGLRHWKFNQFDPSMLDYVMGALEKFGRVDATKWSSPVHIGKGIANMVRAPDGLIETNFTNEFEDGKNPNEWEGSAEIFRQFVSTGQSVKYGQCHTLSGVMVTAYRVLGIPARVVTGFTLPVTPDEDQFADVFVDEDGMLVDDIPYQRLWHYTSWAEAWMARKDLNHLNKNYDGWQASYSMIGPAPVAAIRSGDVQVPYHTKIFFCVLNSYYYTWKYYSKYERLKIISKDRRKLASCIMTKDAADDDENISGSYKAPNSKFVEPERLNKRYKDYIRNDPFRVVRFKSRAPAAVYFGKKIRLSLSANNSDSDSHYAVTISIAVYPELYNGKKGDIIKKEKWKNILKKRGEHRVEMVMRYEDYKKVLKPEMFLYCVFYGRIEDVDFDYFAEHSVRIKQPELGFRVSKNVDLSHTANMDITLYNPLHLPLNKCRFTLSEADSQNFLEKYKDLINSKEKYKVKFLIQPQRPGCYDFVAKFTSNEFTTWTMARIEISPPPKKKDESDPEIPFMAENVKALVKDVGEIKEQKDIGAIKEQKEVGAIKDQKTVSIGGIL